MEREKIEVQIGKDWEEINSQIPNGVNPHAYRFGWLRGYQQKLEESWIDVQSDIVIPNELLLVRYYNDEYEVIFYDELRLPNFRWYIPISKLAPFPNPKENA